ncbi:peptidase inhibitor 16-like [Asterias amurensis]|uniref:peptidase inhibitor 16-like n=1 Tax=Asterias amurensis TaxID=7602 RepID=UPI003AB1F17D
MAFVRSFVFLLAFCVCIHAELLTEDEKKTVLDVHNIWRRAVQPTSSNMIKLQWSDVLANGANDWVAQCKKGNNRFLNSEPSAMKENFKRIGQNHWSEATDKLDMTAIVNSWGNEFEYYSYKMRRCVSKDGVAPTCGRYTQVVRAKTEFIGCAKNVCQEDGISLVTCFYGPGGNSFFTSPYKKGTPCKRCPKGYTCEDKLCVDPNPSERALSDVEFLDFLLE